MFIEKDKNYSIKITPTDDNEVYMLILMFNSKYFRCNSCNIENNIVFLNINKKFERDCNYIYKILMDKYYGLLEASTLDDWMFLVCRSLELYFVGDFVNNGENKVNRKNIESVNIRKKNDYYCGDDGKDLFDRFEEGLLSKVMVIGFYVGNIIKYVVRYKDKNGKEDLLKARNYIGQLISFEENLEENHNIKEEDVSE